MVNDKDVALVLMVFFVLFAVNFSPQLLGIIYFAMVTTYLIAKTDIGIADLNVYNPTKNFGSMLLMAGIIVVGWLFMSQYAMSLIGTPSTSLQSAVRLLADNTTPPYITEIPVLFWFVFGFLIPIAETLFFFGVLMPFLMKKMKFSYADKSKWVAIILAIGLIAALAHYTAHIFSNEALLADFIFFTLSGIVVLYKKDMSLAILIHIISNSVIILGMIGVLA